MEQNKGEKRTAEQAEITNVAEETKQETPKKQKKEVPITAPPITEENKEEIAKKVLKQIHFYFSDSNMNDKFLRKKIEEDASGFVDLSVLTSFNRMKEICVDINFIANVLKERSNKVIVEGTKVKRTTPWPTEDTSGSRTIKAKNIPEDWNLDKIEEFFQQIGTVNKVTRCRKDRKKNGSPPVLIEFETEEMAKKALETPLSIGETIVTVSTLNGTEDTKKKSKEEYQKKKEEKRNVAIQEALKKFEDIEKGRVIKFSDLPPETPFAESKEKFKSIGENAWILYKDNDTFGHLKFKTAAEAKDYLEKLLQIKPLFKEKELTYKILEGEEEDAFWEVQKHSFANKKARKGKGGKGKGKWGRGKRKK